MSLIFHLIQLECGLDFDLAQPSGEQHFFAVKTEVEQFLREAKQYSRFAGSYLLLHYAGLSRVSDPRLQGGNGFKGILVVALATAALRWPWKVVDADYEALGKIPRKRRLESLDDRFSTLPSHDP